MRGCLIPHASLSSVCVWEKEGGRRNVAALGSDDRSVWRSRKVGDRQETLTSGNQVVMETTPTTKTGRRGGPIFHWPSQSSNHSLPKAPLTKKMQWDFQWKSNPFFLPQNWRKKMYCTYHECLAIRFPVKESALAFWADLTSLYKRAAYTRDQRV